MADTKGQADLQRMLKLVRRRQTHSVSQLLDTLDLQFDNIAIGELLADLEAAAVEYGAPSDMTIAASM